MAPVTLDRKERSWLASHAQEWVDAGLISPDQAEGIKRLEHVGEALPPQRLTLTAEVASYVGSVFAVMGGAAVVGQSWEDLALPGRLGVGLAIMLVGFLTGTWLMRIGEAGTTRLGSLLWAVGTGGVAIAMFAAMKETNADDGVVALVVGLAVMTVSVGLWRNLARPLQLVTAAVGFGVSLGGLGEMVNSPVWVGGIVLLAVGLALAVGAALGRLQPRLLALSLGALGAYVGGFMLGDLSEHLGPAAALLIAVAAVVLALRDRLVPLLVLSVIGALIATQALLATTFAGAVSALIVTVLGLVIVVAAIMRTRRPA